MKSGKLKFKSTFQERIDKRQQKEREKQEKAWEAKQFQQLFKEKVIAKDTVVQYPVVKGTGKITTSGKSIHGMDTCFKKQLEKGDFLVLTNPTLKTKEERQICLILSDKSILLEEAFVQQQMTFGPFQIRKKPLVKQGEDMESQYQKRLEQIQKTKKIHKQKGVLEVRTKKGMWSYETKKQEVDKDASREHLLDIRSKLIRDKHCW